MASVNVQMELVGKTLNNNDNSGKPSTPSYLLDCHGAIRFNGFGQEASENAPYAIIKSFKNDIRLKGTHARSGRGIIEVRNFMRDTWKLDDPKMIISVTGGAKRFYIKQRLLDRFKRGLMKAAAATEAWIITGGTQSGVMELVGEAVRDHMLQNGSYQQNLVVLGIAVLGVVSNQTHLKDGASDARRFSAAPATIDYNFDDGLANNSKQNFLDPHHTHFILVDDGVGKFGGEIDFRAKLEAQKSDSKNIADIPVVSLVLEGGPNTLQTAAEAVDAGTAVVVFAGSGRAADFIAAACELKDDDLGRIRSLAKKLYTEDDPALEVKAQQSIDLVCRMLQKPHLLTIYRADSDSSPEIDQAILNAVLKANGMQIDKQTPDFQSWKRCAQLAVVWNHCDIARHSIFNAENRSHWQEDRSFIDEMLLDVLTNDKFEFVLLFLDSGINLKKFLTPDRLTVLYEKTLKTSGVIGGLVKNLLSRTEATYCNCTSTHDEEESHSFQKLINKVIDGLTHHLYEKDHVVDDCPERELFIWAVLFNRMELARLFWKGCRDHIGAALVASMLLEGLSNVANKFEEFQLAKTLSANATDFEQMATGVLDECYNSDQAMSHKLLVRELDLWAQRSVISLSNTGTHMDFMVHDCCQTKLTKIWFGRMAIYTPMWMIIGGMILPFLFLPFIEFDHRHEGDQQTPSGGSNAAVSNDPEAPHPRPKSPAKNGDANFDQQNDDENDDVGSSGSFVSVRPRSPLSCCSSSCCKNFTNIFETLADFYKAPVVKFIGHSVSYLFLVGLLSYFLMIDLHPQQPSIIEYIVWGWSLTLAFEMIREIYSRDETRLDLKLAAYFGDMFNVIKALKYLLLIVAVILRYTLVEPYFIWAINVYTVTMVLFYIRILQLYYVERNLGPKVIMIRLMVRDLLFFLFLLFVFMFALGVASQTLMYPNSDPTWSVLYNVVYYPYYAVYQQYPFDQLLGQVSGCSSNYSVYSDASLNVPRCSYNSWLLNVLFAIYVLIIGIMLLNILIAVFSYTFNNVQEQSEKTWSFHRFSLTKEYHDKPTLVPPFIVFNHIWRLFGLLYQKFSRHSITRNDFKLKYNADLYKRLTAFEHAGTENYLHTKREQEHGETEWKANATLKKLDHLVTSVDSCKEQVNRLVSLSSSLDRESSSLKLNQTPAMREVTAAALTVAMSQTAQRSKPDEGSHHRCHHKKSLKSLNDRISTVEQHLASQSAKIDAILAHVTGGVRKPIGAEDEQAAIASPGNLWTINVASDVDVDSPEKTGLNSI